MRQTFELSFPPLFTGILILFIATRIQDYLKDKGFPSFIAIISYTVADIYSSQISSRIPIFGSRYVLFIGFAVVLYFMDTRSYGCTGICLYRTAKFVLVEELVTVVVGTGLVLVYHPVVWLGVGLCAVYFVHQMETVVPKQLETIDAILHSVAVAVTAQTIGIPLRITTFEVILGLISVYTILSVMNRSPVQELLRSLALFLIILNLSTFGIIPLVLIILSDISV